MTQHIIIESISPVLRAKLSSPKAISSFVVRSPFLETFLQPSLELKNTLLSTAGDTPCEAACVKPDLCPQWGVVLWGPLRKKLSYCPYTDSLA